MLWLLTTRAEGSRFKTAGERDFVKKQLFLFNQIGIGNRLLDLGKLKLVRKKSGTVAG